MTKGISSLKKFQSRLTFSETFLLLSGNKKNIKKHIKCNKEDIKKRFSNTDLEEIADVLGEPSLKKIHGDQSETKADPNEPAADTRTC